MPKWHHEKGPWRVMAGFFSGLYGGLSGRWLVPAADKTQEHAAGPIRLPAWERRPATARAPLAGRVWRETVRWTDTPAGALCLAGLVTLAVLGVTVALIRSGWRPVARAAAGWAKGPSAGLNETPASAPGAQVPWDVLAFDPHVPPRAWTAIVLHHSATARGNAASFGEYHRLHRGWRSLGYHFVIGNGLDAGDGSIEAGPRWRAQEPGAHANHYEFNQRGIGICLVGNFEEGPPTRAQIRAARRLVRELRERFEIPKSRVFGHAQIRQGGGTLCPGRYFPMREILEGPE